MVGSSQETVHRTPLMDTVALEAHKLARRTEQWSDCCASWDSTEQDYALVNSSTLDTVARYTLSVCACGTETLTR